MIRGVAKVKAKLKSTGVIVWYHYVCRGGPQFWIGDKNDDESTPGYTEAYKAITENPKEDVPPTIAMLAQEWKTSMEWDRLAVRTQEDYTLGLEDFIEEFGEVEAARLMNDVALKGLVRAWIQRKGWRNKNADKRLDAAKGLATWLTIAHPETYHQSLLLGMPKFYKYKPRAESLWTDKEVKKFRDHGAPRLSRAVLLMRGVGCRIGDAVWLGPQHAFPRKSGGYAIIWTPGKTANSTGAVANVVADADVEEIIRTTPEGQPTFLVDTRGRPWDERTLGKEISLEAKRLGIKDDKRRITPNDLRGSKATELAWGGASVKEMALRMGWTEATAAKMMGVYTSRNPDALTDSNGTANAEQNGEQNAPDFVEGSQGNGGEPSPPTT